MAPYYRLVTSCSATQSNPLLVLDAALLESMEKANKEELDKLDERLTEAQKMEGESKISDALKAKANHLMRVGEKVRSCFYLVAILLGLGELMALDRIGQLRHSYWLWRRHWG